MEDMKLENKSLSDGDVVEEIKEIEEKPRTFNEDQLYGLATITLSHTEDESENPSTVVCFGWHDVSHFNKAFKKEGWSDLGQYEEKDLSHQWAIFRDYKFTFSKENVLGYRKITVTNWEQYE